MTLTPEQRKDLRRHCESFTNNYEHSAWVVRADHALALLDALEKAEEDCRKYIISSKNAIVRSIRTRGELEQMQAERDVLVKHFGTHGNCAICPIPVVSCPVTNHKGCEEALQKWLAQESAKRMAGAKV